MGGVKDAIDVMHAMVDIMFCSFFDISDITDINKLRVASSSAHFAGRLLAA